MAFTNDRVQFPVTNTTAPVYNRWMLINTDPVNQSTPTAIGAIALSADLLAAQVAVQITAR